MNKRHAVYVGAMLVAVLAFMAIPLAAGAHTSVPLLDGNRAQILDGTTPYSTKMTCGGCHFNCLTGAYDTDKTTWCTTGNQKDCRIDGACPDYASSLNVNNPDQSLISLTSHSQGYPTSAGTVSFMTYTVASPAHGASVGLHSQHGRNENLTAAQRTIWSQAAFISGTGMFGRY